MINFLKSIGGFIIGIVGLLVIVFLALFFIKGGIWLGPKVLPWLYIVMWLVLAIDILVMLPLGIFKKTRGVSGVGLFVSSFVYGLTLWFWALLLTYSIWGMIAVLVGLFIAGVGVVPIAMLATAIKGEWATTGQLVLLLFLTFGSRVLGSYIAMKADELSFVEPDVDLTQESVKGLSVGVYILSILFIILGGIWVYNSLLSFFYSGGNLLVYFIYGVPYLIGGIGMLKRKHWALRFSQVFLIISILPLPVILIPFLKGESISLVGVLLGFTVLLIFYGLPIWFLFKKSTVNQFRRKQVA